MRDPVFAYKFCLGEIAVLALLHLLAGFPGEFAVGWALGSASYAYFNERIYFAK